MKIIISLVLLFSFAFTCVHEYVFAFYDNDHCDTTEYVHELSAPSDHGDICDMHFEYHQAFILPPYTQLAQSANLSLTLHLIKEQYNFQTNLKFIKPPIA